MAERRLGRGCWSPDGSGEVGIFTEVCFWEVNIWSKVTFVSLKQGLISLWLTKPWLSMPSEDWCDPWYEVKGFVYASPSKDNKYFFSRPVLGNYLGYLALLGLECLWNSRSQSYPIHPRGICTWGWALCVSVLSIKGLDAAGFKFPVWEQVLMCITPHLLQH